MLIKNEFAYRPGNMLEKVQSILNVKTEQEAEKIANKMNRKSIGVEISKQYCDVIVKRLKLPIQMELF